MTNDHDPGEEPPDDAASAASRTYRFDDSNHDERRRERDRRDVAGSSRILPPSYLYTRPRAIEARTTAGGRNRPVQT